MKNGWQTKTLGEVCQFRGGGTPSKAVERYWRGDIPWVSPKDMKFDVVSDSIDHISHEAIDGSATSLIPKDSVLIVVRSGILARMVPIAITGRELTINQDLKALCPKGVINARFLYYLLHSRMDELLSIVSRGATVHRLMTEQIRSLGFILPPITDQLRIVSMLDEAFEGIATAKANTEKNLQSARTLFESQLQSIFTVSSKDWMKKRLGDLAQMHYGYTESASSENVGPKFLRITDIKDNGVDWSSVPYCPIDTSDLAKYKLSDGDIVFARTGATTGKSYLVRNPPNAVFASYLIRVQLSTKEVLPRFVNLFFQTQTYWDSIRAGVSGSAQGGFNATKLAELVIPFPKLQKEQESIATKFDVLSNQTQRLEFVFQKKLAALEVLKKSLLHQAFTGNL